MLHVTNPMWCGREISYNMFLHNMFHEITDARGFVVSR